MGYMCFYIHDIAGDIDTQMCLSTFASTDVKSIRAFACARRDYFKRFPAATDCDEFVLYDLSPRRSDAEWTAAILRVVAALAAGLPRSTIGVFLYSSSGRVQCLPAIAAGVGAAVVDIGMRDLDNCAIPPIPCRAAPLVVSVNGRVIHPPNK